MNRQDGIHMDALAAALAETGDTASRAAPALDGLEIVQLCLYAELPLSAVMDAEEDQ